MPFELHNKKQKSPHIHVGDVGTEFIIIIVDENRQVQNLSRALSFTIKFRTPSHEVKERIGELYTDGSDGKIVYTLEDGDIDSSGLWSYQAIIEFISGTWHTNIVKFKVFPNIEIPVI